MLRDRDRLQLKPWFPYLKLFITALFKIEPCVAKVVWRGVKADLHSKYHRGERYTWWAFSSCKTIPAAASNYTSASVQAKVDYCGGNACKKCGNCRDWRWDENHSWFRVPDATCRHKHAWPWDWTYWNHAFYRCRCKE
ncbi:unnamed protein product [Rotaria sp. Silwood2]|nr:unnamed protein product [Rotaria sp. Silwood2]